MGRVKEAMIEAETTRFSDWHSGEKYVCSELFDDDNIKQFIKGNGVIGNCDYCGKKTKVVDVVNLARWFHEKITQYFCPLQEMFCILLFFDSIPPDLCSQIFHFPEDFPFGSVHSPFQKFHLKGQLDFYPGNIH